MLLKPKWKWTGRANFIGTRNLKEMLVQWLLLFFPPLSATSRPAKWEDLLNPDLLKSLSSWKVPSPRVALLVWHYTERNLFWCRQMKSRLTYRGGWGLHRVTPSLGVTGEGCWTGEGGFSCLMWARVSNYSWYTGWGGGLQRVGRTRWGSGGLTVTNPPDAHTHRCRCQSWVTLCNGTAINIPKWRSQSCFALGMYQLCNYFNRMNVLFIYLYEPS